MLACFTIALCLASYSLVDFIAHIDIIQGIVELVLLDVDAEVSGHGSLLEILHGTPVVHQLGPCQDDDVQGHTPEIRAEIIVPVAGEKLSQERHVEGGDVVAGHEKLVCPVIFQDMPVEDVQKLA